MSTQIADTSAKSSIVVTAPIERAFAVFSDGIDSWWPREHTIGAAPMREIVLEPRAGGRAYTIDVDGGECDWGRVLVYEPPRRLVLSWDITLTWKREGDPARCSEVEVAFVAEGPDRTRVELEHRHLERHGEGWEEMRNAVASERGWPMTLARYAQQTANGGD
jgi:uncharacterized protein YndB with AHSA1/START domain